MKRLPAWVLLGAVSIASAAIAIYLFPKAFSIVALDITMNREQALREARTIAARDGLGPREFREAASFALDDTTQTFVELEGGGKEAFTRMMRERLYLAYTWRVRHFREEEINETLIRFAPDGQPYGFVEKLKEEQPGPALPADDARRRAEADAVARWRVDLAPFGLVEQGQERRPGGRVDHTFTYERAAPTLNEGRFRLRLVLSGDRLTEVTYFVRIPEAFTRRYESMRSHNQTIGVVSVVGMVLLYVVGGIGIGLFFMLRKRYVVWRPAAVWGFVVGGLQALVSLNEWPLLWMTYDTAIPRGTFLSWQIAIVGATLIGFSSFLALSFMAAETLTRKAFGDHPQFWRVWEKGPGSSTAILGRTVAGYLLVAIFFAYDVGLYLMATRWFGWWTPAEALLHPDVLATYVPWLSAIANSLQAGFWEECLFRAVPIAGAALIGDRFGRRGLFVAVAFVIQAIIFGAGHAPYPTQPSYARPVELILPSIGFGLLYLYYGLLPAIVLHFAFDVVWFALPIFLADAPGVWFQKVMVVVMTFVPLWIVLWRRGQVGRWTELARSDVNASWTPPAYVEPEPEPVAPVQHGISPRAKAAWLAVGAVGGIICIAAMFGSRADRPLNASRTAAATAARELLAARGVTLGPGWHVLPTPDEGSSDAHEFVAETAGVDRMRQLVGVYLPEPRWQVRVVTFQGDVVERAEEWRVLVDREGKAFRAIHSLPESRRGASLEEAAARERATAALAKEFNLDLASGQAREVSARPAKLPNRTDWTFTFADTSQPPLPSGELRLEIVLAGDEVARVRRYVFVPQDWERRQQAAETRNLILRILVGVVFGGLLVAAAVAGIVSWSRGRYTPRLFVMTTGFMFLIALIAAVNNWPVTFAQLQTAIPLPLQVGGAIGIGLVALIIAASLPGLVIGGVPAKIDAMGRVPDRDALQLGVAAGLFGAGLAALAGWLKTPDWARVPDVASAGAFIPILDAALDPLAAFFTRTAIVLSVVMYVSLITFGWTRRRAVGTFALLVLGFLAAGAPTGGEIAGWLVAGALLAGGLLAVYTLLLRADLTMTPVAVGTMMGAAALIHYAQRPFPGAIAGAILGAIGLVLVMWFWFRALRRPRAVAAAAPVTTTGA